MCDRGNRISPWEAGAARHDVATAPPAARRARHLELPPHKRIGQAARAAVRAVSVRVECKREVVGHARDRPRGGHDEGRLRLKASAKIKRAHAAHPRLEDVVLENEAHARCRVRCRVRRRPADGGRRRQRGRKRAEGACDGGEQQGGEQPQKKGEREAAKEQKCWLHI